MIPVSIPVPIYTPKNCIPAYQLSWGVTFSWRTPQTEQAWLDPLRQLLERDGVRLLRHRYVSDAQGERRISQFLVSTKPDVAPVLMVQRLKGRLQHLIRSQQPKAFRGGHSFRSLGSTTREHVEAYLCSQLEHHLNGQDRMRDRFRDLQLEMTGVDLSEMRASSHGQYWYNLHIVVVNQDRWRELSLDRLELIRATLPVIAQKRGHLLSRAGILPDHLHLSIGCTPDLCPEQVALCYMNNLAYVLGMNAVYEYSYYVGTFGEYSRNGANRQ